MSALARKELLRFLLIGGLTVCVDYFFYRMSLLFIGGVGIAKALGFGGGTVFAYFANRYWTFSTSQVAPGSVWRFCCVYGGNLCVNVALNSAVLSMLAGSRYAMNAAFLVATGASACLNFLGMKFFVFSGLASEGEGS